MKPSKLYPILFLCIAFIAIETLTGCRKPRHCEYLVCQNGGYCDADTCVCKPGYTSALCQNNIRDQYLGTYTGTLTVSTPPTSIPATVEVKAGTNPNDIILSSQIGSINATIEAGGYFVIPSQTVAILTTTGSGSFAGKSLNFTLNQSAFTYTLTSNFTGTKP